MSTQHRRTRAEMAKFLEEFLEKDRAALKATTQKLETAEAELKTVTQKLETTEEALATVQAEADQVKAAAELVRVPAVGACWVARQKVARQAWLKIESGYLIVSFAAKYKEDDFRTRGYEMNVMAVAIATLSQMMLARGECPREVALKEPEWNELAQNVDKQFSSLAMPELEMWNNWCQSVKPGLVMDYSS